MTSESVLFVDDEPHVLSSIRRQLARYFNVLTATSGPAALELLAAGPPVAVVVSDMRMPGMSGAELLHQIRERYPFIVRVILSGQSDLDSAIAAVNDGHIFRFVTKPADATTLCANVQAALDQYHLVATRAELLQKTLQGLVDTLTDILGLTNPVARQRTLRVTHYVSAMAAALNFDMPWELRLAARLSQVGCVTLPAAILDKVYRGEELTADELRQYGAHPQLAAQLIGRIPQLGPVAELIARQQHLKPAELPGDVATWDPATTSAVLLATATTMDESMAVGDQPAEALERLVGLLPGLPAPITRALSALHLHSGGMEIQYIQPAALTLGMVVDQDVVAADGDIVLTRGDEVTRSHLERLRAVKGVAATIAGSQAVPPLRVLVPA